LLGKKTSTKGPVTSFYRPLRARTKRTAEGGRKRKKWRKSPLEKGLGGCERKVEKDVELGGTDARGKV